VCRAIWTQPFLIFAIDERQAPWLVCITSPIARNLPLASTVGQPDGTRIHRVRETGRPITQERATRLT
jgi:hypothetical protein